MAPQALVGSEGAVLSADVSLSMQPLMSTAASLCSWLLGWGLDPGRPAPQTISEKKRKRKREDYALWSWLLGWGLDPGRPAPHTFSEKKREEKKRKEKKRKEKNRKEKKRKEK